AAKKVKDEAEIKLFDAETGAEGATLAGAKGPVLFAPRGDALATAEGGAVKLWDARGKERATLKGASAPLAFSPDGGGLSAKAPGTSSNLWDAPTGAGAAGRRSHTGRVPCLAFARGGKGPVLATGSADRTVRLWGADGKPLHTLTGPAAAVREVVFAP